MKSDRPSGLTFIYRSFFTRNVFVHLRREADTGTSTGIQSSTLQCGDFSDASGDLPSHGFEFSSDFFRSSLRDVGQLNPTINIADFERRNEPLAPGISNESQRDLDAKTVPAVDLGSSLNPTVKPDLVEKPEFRYFGTIQ